MNLNQLMKLSFLHTLFLSENLIFLLIIQVRELELELARTKLCLVEAECRAQDLNHQLMTLTAEMQSSRNNWLLKTFTSIKEAAKKDGVREAPPTTEK